MSKSKSKYKLREVVQYKYANWWELEEKEYVGIIVKMVIDVHQDGKYIFYIKSCDVKHSRTVLECDIIRKVNNVNMLL